MHESIIDTYSLFHNRWPVLSNNKLAHMYKGNNTDNDHMCLGLRRGLRVGQWTFQSLNPNLDVLQLRFDRLNKQVDILGITETG
jgi:hypothetical protein